MTSSSSRIICHFSKIGLHEIKMIGRHEYNSSHPPLPRETHKGIVEIIYVARGKQIFETEGVRRFLFGSDILIIPPGQPHSTADQPEEKGLMYWIQIPCHHKNQLFCPRLSDGNYMLKKILNARHPHFKVPEGLHEHLDALINAFTRTTDTHKKRITVAHHMNHFLNEILESSEGFEPYMQSDKILDSIQYIQENLYETFSVPDLAEISNLSVSRFKTRFKEETGFPPAEYILRRKLEQAKKLLLHKNESITQIAINLGFSSSQYFATVFQRYTTQTPSQFRGKHS